MVAYSLGSEQLSRSHITSEIAALTKTYPLFLVNARKDDVRPIQALNLGARGIIYENDHLDRVLTAIKLLAGENSIIRAHCFQIKLKK